MFRPLQSSSRQTTQRKQGQARLLLLLQQGGV